MRIFILNRNQLTSSNTLKIMHSSKLFNYSQTQSYYTRKTFAIWKQLAKHLQFLQTHTEKCNLYSSYVHSGEKICQYVCQRKSNNFNQLRLSCIDQFVKVHSTKSVNFSEKCSFLSPFNGRRGFDIHLLDRNRSFFRRLDCHLRRDESQDAISG